jgi:PhnB protein
MKMTTYLNYGGNCAEALRFYEQHLGGKIVSMSTFAGMPGPANIPPGLTKDSVLHARIMIGDAVLMASDAPPEIYKPMRSAYLALSLENSSEVEKLYALLTEGGEIFMKLEETFFAHRFAMLRDRFGTSWMLIHERPMHGEN